MAAHEPAIRRPIRLREVRQIAALRDPVLRNLLITLAYHDLAHRMGAVIGDRNLTWCAFATWASKTAGREIREEEIPGVLRARIESSDAVTGAVTELGSRAGWLAPALHWLLGRHLRAFADRVGRDIADAIGRGNLVVFAELGPLYAGAIEAHERRAAARGEQRSEDGGWDAPGTHPRVAAAFRCYERAAVESDEQRKAELVLLANLLAVQHEQERLQPYIARSLDTPVEDMLCARQGLPIARWTWRVLRRLFPDETRPLVCELDKVVQEAVTDTLMTLPTPGQTLRLCDDVPPPPRGPFFPPDLQNLELSELAVLVKQLDATGGTGVGSGASDWAVLSQRMNYIVTLFRSRQQHAALLEEPFDATQQRALERGRIPRGPL